MADHRFGYRGRCPTYEEYPRDEENYTRYRIEGGQPAQFGAALPARPNLFKFRNPYPGRHGTYPAQPEYRGSLPTRRIVRSSIEPSMGEAVGGWDDYRGMVNQYRQPGRDSSLSRPTDDINEIVVYLKQAAKPLSEPKPATRKRDATPEVSGVEDLVKPQNNSKSLPESKPEPESESEPIPTTADAAHLGTFTSREAVSTTADMAHSTVLLSREAAKRFNGVLM